MLEALARAVLDADEGLGVPPMSRLAEIDNLCTPSASASTIDSIDEKRTRKTLRTRHKRCDTPEDL